MADLGFQPQDEVPTEARTWTGFRSFVRWEILLLVLLGGTIAFGAHVSPYFLQSTNLFYICLNVGEVAIMALPLTLIVVTGEIDLSVASMLGLTGVLMAELFKHGWPIWPAMIAAVVLHATPLGRAIFAIGAGQEAAFFAGIRVKRIKFWLFVLSGMLSGFAGVLWSLRFASARYDSGAGLELFVVTIVLLGGVSIFGGRGTIAGVVVAVAVLGCLQTALTADLIPAQDQNIVVGALLIASVILPNAGDLYRRARARLRSASARRHAAAVAQAEGR